MLRFSLTSEHKILSPSFT